MPDVTRDAEGKWLRDDSALANGITELANATADALRALIANPPNPERIAAAIDWIELIGEQAGAIDPGKDELE